MSYPADQASNVVPLASGVACLSLRRIDKGNLFAFCDLKIIAWNLVLRDCKWMRGDPNDWVALPSTSYTDKDGKKHYKTILEFANKEAERRFQAAAIKAMQEFRE